jgi:hypothetical protein
MNDKKKKMLKKGCPIADRTDEVVHYVQEREVSNIRYPSQTARSGLSQTRRIAPRRYRTPGRWARRAGLSSTVVPVDTLAFRPVSGPGLLSLCLGGFRQADYLGTESHSSASWDSLIMVYLSNRMNTRS